MFETLENRRMFDGTLSRFVSSINNADEVQNTAGTITQEYQQTQESAGAGDCFAHPPVGVQRTQMVS